MECFKVISLYNNKLVSYNISSCDYVNEKRIAEGSILEYKVGEWVYPKIKNSNLFCFGDLLHAHRYISYGDELEDHTQIFRCEVLNPSSKGYWTGTSFDMDSLLEYIARGEKEDISSHSLVEGTVFCDAIRLLEEIQ